jgi:putative membrane protein
MGWLAGAVLLGWLVTDQDWPRLWPLLVGVGPGLALLCAWHLLPMLLDTLGWRVLLPPEPQLPLRRLLVMRWLGESVNALLPALQVGGDLLRARLSAQAGVPGGAAAAAIVLDLTLSVATLGLFLAAGLLLALASMDGLPLVGPAMLLTGAGMAALAGFIALQRTGGLARRLRTLAARLASPALGSLAGTADAFDVALARLYRDRRALLRSSALALAAWVLGAGEVWLALKLLGYQPSLFDALLLECLVQAVRNAAFMVPGALGIQEGALLLAAPAFGLPAEAGFALALLRRLRELLLGLPGLAWAWLRAGPATRRGC